MQKSKLIKVAVGLVATATAVIGLLYYKKLAIMSFLPTENKDSQGTL